MKLIVSIILFTGALFSFSFPQHGHYRIEIPEYKLTIVPDSCIQTISKVDKKNSVFFKMNLRNCKGAMLFECYSLKDSILKEKGNYIASLDLLKSYTDVYNPTKQTMKKVVTKYYQPLRNGTWQFYDSLGNLKKTVIYKNGIVQDSLN